MDPFSSANPNPDRSSDASPEGRFPDPASLDFDKLGGLLPAIIQHAETGEVLMLGFMNREAAEKTAANGLVTFHSRTKGRLWTKGETSGNVLRVVEARADCDRDTLLVSVIPAGPVCHTGSRHCFEQPE